MAAAAWRAGELVRRVRLSLAMLGGRRVGRFSSWLQAVVALPNWLMPSWKHVDTGLQRDTSASIRATVASST